LANHELGFDFHCAKRRFFCKYKIISAECAGKMAILIPCKTPSPQNNKAIGRCPHICAPYLSLINKVWSRLGAREAKKRSLSDRIFIFLYSYSSLGRLNLSDYSFLWE